MFSEKKNCFSYISEDASMMIPRSILRNAQTSTPLQRRVLTPVVIVEPSVDMDTPNTTRNTSETRDDTPDPLHSVQQFTPLSANNSTNFNPNKTVLKKKDLRISKYFSLFVLLPSFNFQLFFCRNSKAFFS